MAEIVICKQCGRVLQANIGNKHREPVYVEICEDCSSGLSINTFAKNDVKIEHTLQWDGWVKK